MRTIEFVVNVHKDYANEPNGSLYARGYYAGCTLDELFRAIQKHEVLLHVVEWHKHPYDFEMTIVLESKSEKRLLDALFDLYGHEYTTPKSEVQKILADEFGVR